MDTFQQSKSSRTLRHTERGWRGRLAVSGAAVALLALTASTATAIPITYTYHGNGTGSVNAVAFTNADYVITLTGDTTATFVYNPGVIANATSGTMEIAGVGVATITEPGIGTFISTSGPVVGFWKIGVLDYLNFNDPLVAGWQLATPIGPIADIVPGAPTQFVNVGSSLGPITLSSTGPIVYQATVPCPATPDVLCATSPQGSLTMQGNTIDPTRQKLKWKWSKGTAAIGDFGAPVTVGASNYLFCLYDDDAPVTQWRIASVGTCGTKPCWSTNGTTTTKYKNKAGNSDGITGVKFGAGTDKAQISLSAKGAAVDLPFPLADTTSVKVQLWHYDSAGSDCWSTTLASPAKANDPVNLKFSDKAP